MCVNVTHIYLYKKNNQDQTKHKKGRGKTKINYKNGHTYTKYEFVCFTTNITHLYGTLGTHI